jgi:hypothetical protein
MNYLARKRCTCLSQITILEKSHSDCSGAPRPVLTAITLGVSSNPVKEGGQQDTRHLMRYLTPPRLPPTEGTGSHAASTNCIQSMIEICRDHCRNVKRWRDGRVCCVGEEQDQAGLVDAS